jgi:hypothetical protein
MAARIGILLDWQRGLERITQASSMAADELLFPLPPIDLQCSADTHVEAKP